jgi:hypothetical protein
MEMGPARPLTFVPLSVIRHIYLLIPFPRFLFIFKITYSSFSYFLLPFPVSYLSFLSFLFGVLFLYYMAVLFSFLTASRPPPHGLCLFSRRDQGQGGITIGRMMEQTLRSNGNILGIGYVKEIDE